MMETEEEQIRVRSADNMDLDVFRKHMEARHDTAPGWFKYMDQIDTEYLERCWRAYHNSIHRFELNGTMDHYHGH